MAKSYSQIMFDFKAPEGEERKDPVLPGPEFDDPAFEPETLAMEADQEVRDITELSLVQAGPETLSADPPVSPASKSGRGRKSQKTYAAAADLVDVPEDAVLFSKQYYSIGEVSRMFRVNPSLLRFWESEFDIIKPRKNKKGDRHFRPADIKNIQLIYDLLRRRKLTIDGAKSFLKNNKRSQERFEMIQSLQKIRAFLLEIKSSLH